MRPKVQVLHPKFATHSCLPDETLRVDAAPGCRQRHLPIGAAMQAERAKRSRFSRWRWFCVFGPMQANHRLAMPGKASKFNAGSPAAQAGRHGGPLHGTVFGLPPLPPLPPSLVASPPPGRARCSVWMVRQWPRPQCGQPAASICASRARNAAASSRACGFGRRHVQRRPGCGHALGLERRAQQPVVADALESGRQHMPQKAADELRPVDEHAAHAAVIVGAHAGEPRRR